MFRRLSFLLCLILFAVMAGILPASSVASPTPPPAEALKARLWADSLLSYLPYSPAGAADLALPVESAPASVTPTDQAEASRIAFESYRDGNWELYLARGDGTAAVRLTNHAASDVRPRLNRGATKVVFASNRGGNYDVYSMNADGSNVRQLTTHGPTDSYPAWSPDGNRIAFAYYKDNDWEIYTMNADGSGQTRLTFGEGTDISPAWSPDGRQIAWVRQSGDTGRIMVMNADGSGQRALTQSMRYLQHPAWSPDGAQLACDYDADGDEWNELAVMQANGSGLHTVYDANQNLVDAWMGSWSPDGTQLLFTLVLYVVQGGQLYLGTTGLVKIPAAGGTATALPGSGYDMRPDWQTADLLAPSSSVQVLPAQSPAPFTVRWSGTDAGPAGIASFDVQVRDGPAGAWTDWHMGTTDTSASYPGVGGHAYYFRVRARDHSGNLEAWPAGYDAFTTVEALPPVSAVGALPPYSRNGVTIRWGGNDPGGSGIKHYDVQVRDGTTGNWTAWQTRTTFTSASFSGTAGRSYAFRVRATDNAQNVEAWPAGAGDTSTLLYTWAVTGTVRDNLGRPVAGAAITAEPAAFQGRFSDAAGTYALYVADSAATYAVAWTRPGSGDLPITHFDAAEDAHVDAILPPLHNVVLNWGFESGSLGPAWLSGGLISPVVTDEARHTGSYGVVLGQPTPGLSSPYNLSGSLAWGNSPCLVVDRSNIVHVVWASAGDIYYARRSADGTWSAPRNISNSNGSVYAPLLSLGDTGVIHVLWRGNGSVTYARGERNGSWSAPQPIPNSPDATWGLQMAVDRQGAVHVVWADYVPGGYVVNIYYARRGNNGVWSVPRNLSNSDQHGFDPQVAVDTAGNVHVLWWERRMSNEHIAYVQRTPDGVWSAVQNISGDQDMVIGSPRLAVDTNDNVHAVFPLYYGHGIFYARRDRNGIWSGAQCVSTDWGNFPELVTDVRGIVHLVWEANGILYYARKLAGDAWSTPERVAEASLYPMYPQLAVSAQGIVHAGWAVRLPSGQRDVYYARRDRNGHWSLPQRLSDMPTWTDRPPRLGVDSMGNPHIVWDNEVTSGGVHVFYSGPRPADSTDDSIVQQAVTVPVSMGTPTLSFVYKFGQMWPGNDSWLTTQVQDGVGTTTVLSTTTSTSDWTHRWFDLAPWAGQTITLTFNLHQTVGQPAAWAYLDEVSLGTGTYPDLWLSTRHEIAQPGETVTFTLAYGNRGDAFARGTQLTVTLPAELAFVAADPPPSTTEPALTWDLGDLPAGSGPSAIVLTAVVSPTVPLGSVLTGAAGIASGALELEPDNNQAPLLTLVGGSRYYLPLTMEGRSP